MFIRPCPLSAASAGFAWPAAFAAENIPADADVIVIGNAIRRGNPGGGSGPESQTFLPVAAGSR